MKSLVRAFLILLLSIMLLPLYACGNKNISNSQNLHQTDQPTTDDSRVRENNDEFNELSDTGTETGNYRYPGVFDSSLSYVSTEDGLYEVINVFPNSANIMYYDYDTCQQVFLCNKPECTHDNESCNSYLGIASVDTLPPTLLFAGDKLLLIKQGASEVQNPYIIAAKKDGSDRKVLLELESDEIIGSEFLTDGTNLIFKLTSPSSLKLGVCVLVRLNLSTGKLTEIMSMDSIGYKIVGFAGNDIIFLQMSEPMKVIRINPNNPDSAETVYTWNTEKEATFVLYNYIFSLDRINNSLKRIDITTGEEETIKTDIDSMGDEVGIRYAFDNNLIIDILRPDEQNGLRIEQYFVDFQSHEILPNNLEIELTHRPVTIVAEYKNYLCIMSGHTEHTAVGENSAGEAMEYTYITTDYSLLSKDDFRASQPNYVEFTHAGV